MKKFLAMLLAVVLVLSFAACTPSEDTTTTGGNTPNPSGSGNTDDTEIDYNKELAGDYGEITIWVSELDKKDEDGNVTASVVATTQKQIEAFQKKYPDINFTVKIDGVSESNAASNVIADVASAPDIYCFAQDQLTRLVQAGALLETNSIFTNIIKSENSAGSVNAASVAGKVYAFPLTDDNGYFMYYDKSIFSEEDVEDLATLVRKCEENNVKFAYGLENAWYTASFFFATGCTSSWTMNSDGKFTALEDTFNSEAGLIAMKGMQILAKSSAYSSNENSCTDCGVWITGTWNSQTAADYYGENLGATDLPSFTVDGKSYHLGSYSGCKLMGVKPQSDSKKGLAMQLLATYLTNEESQTERFNTFGWGPSNLKAQATDAVQADISLVALSKQNAYAIPQGNIDGGWWDIAKLLGAEARTAETDEALWAALKSYEDSANGLLNQTEEEKLIWSVIGSMQGTGWNTDFTMTKQDDGTYLSEAITFALTDNLKLRRGGKWDVQVGELDDEYYLKSNEIAGQDKEPSDILPELEGKYQVKLTIDGTDVDVEFIPAN